MKFHNVALRGNEDWMSSGGGNDDWLSSGINNPDWDSSLGRLGADDWASGADNVDWLSSGIDNSDWSSGLSGPPMARRQRPAFMVRPTREAPYGHYGQAAEAAAVTSSEASGMGRQSNVKSIILGVGTGLAVWAITRVLDAHFLPRKR